MRGAGCATSVFCSYLRDSLLNHFEMLSNYFCVLNCSLVWKFARKKCKAVLWPCIWEACCHASLFVKAVGFAPLISLENQKDYSKRLPCSFVRQKRKGTFYKWCIQVLGLGVELYGYAGIWEGQYHLQNHLGFSDAWKSIPIYDTAYHGVNHKQH